MNDNDSSDMAAVAGNRMSMPTNALGKVEVVLYRDGTIRIANLPNDVVARALLKHGLEMLDDGMEPEDRQIEITGISCPEVFTLVPIIAHS